MWGTINIFSRDSGKKIDGTCRWKNKVRIILSLDISTVLTKKSSKQFFRFPHIWFFLSKTNYFKANLNISFKAYRKSTENSLKSIQVCDFNFSSYALRKGSRKDKATQEKRHSLWLMTGFFHKNCFLSSHCWWKFSSFCFLIECQFTE